MCVPVGPIFILQRYKFIGQRNTSRSSKNMNILACYVLKQPAGYASAIFLSAISGIFFKQHTCSTEYCEGRRQDMNFFIRIWKKQEPIFTKVQEMKTWRNQITLKLFRCFLHYKVTCKEHTASLSKLGTRENIWPHRHGDSNKHHYLKNSLVGPPWPRPISPLNLMSIFDLLLNGLWRALKALFKTYLRDIIIFCFMEASIVSWNWCIMSWTSASVWFLQIPQHHVILLQLTVFVIPWCPFAKGYNGKK